MSDLNNDLLIQIHRFQKAIRQNRISPDIAFHEFIILKNILSFEQSDDLPINPSMLSKKLDMSKSYITAVLNSLEKKHLVLRNVDENDRRRIQIRITSKGRDIFEDKFKKEIQLTEKITHTMSKERTLMLIDLLKQSSDILNDEVDA